jgi:hypothetical protein
VLDVVLLLAFIGLPIASWVITGSVVWTVSRTFFIAAIAGASVQTSMAWGMSWNLRTLQLLTVAALLLSLLLAIRRRRTSTPSGTMRRQVLGIMAPIAVVGGFLILTRLMAPGDPGPLTGVGYIFNHPFAEDSAKWLHLTGQLAAGRDLEFAGYGGGPLLIVMAIAGALSSVLSLLLLGGVNEVAVAVNIFLGSQFLLVAFTPLALAPLVEGRVPPRPRHPGAAALPIPLPLVWLGAGFAAGISAVLTIYGHLSLQFVLIPLVLWAGAFLVFPNARGLRLLTSLTIATLAGAWLPLLGLALIVIAAALVWTIARRWWLGLAAVVITGLASADSLLSPLAYLLGIDAPTSTVVETEGISETGASAVSTTFIPGPAVETFTAGGGTEVATPMLAILAIVSALVVLWWYSRSRRTVGVRSVLPFAPIAVVGVYITLIAIVDALVTVTAPNYGTQKVTFAFAAMVITVMVPLAIAAAEPEHLRMTVFRWGAVGAVVVFLVMDGIGPRAFSALSPQLWAPAASDAPPYWSLAEVRDVPEQSISSLPIACVFAGPDVQAPGGQPDGRLAYTCTRLMIGLNGLEGRSGYLLSWITNDWLQNTTSWDVSFSELQADISNINDRKVIVLNADGSLGGISTLSELLVRYPSKTS